MLNKFFFKEILDKSKEIGALHKDEIYIDFNVSERKGLVFFNLTVEFLIIRSSNGSLFFLVGWSTNSNGLC